MKKALCLITMIIFLSGCQNNNITDSSMKEESQLYTLKWCLEQCTFKEGAMDNLNSALRSDGCQYEIEIVQIPINSEKSYFEQVCEYEEIYGSLDVVSTGYQFNFNNGAAMEFVKSGYYAELENLSEYTAVPEKLWETVKADGKIYTVPNLTRNVTGVTFYFNKDYISQKQIDDFDGDISTLADMVNGLSATENFLPIYYSINYLDYSSSLPYTETGGIILDNISRKAVNPYEYEPFIEYAEKLNELYKKTLFGNEINFSSYEYSNRALPKDFAVMVSQLLLDEDYLSEIGYGNMELIPYTLPCYLESNVLYSMGISANSEHKESAMDFLKRLYSDNKYAKILLDGASSNTMSVVGVPLTNVKEKYENTILSDFVSFELSQEYINSDLEDLLTSRFDILCKSENFNKTLEDINNELKAAGIDGYIDNINKLLEENY